ncbi:MAG TPA: VOC family protein [Geomobilimonas sp.]|nr:VOC family protein [Geomobilimonas sp.]
MSTSQFGFQRVKVIAIAVTDKDRADRFYGTTLGLAPAFEGEIQAGYFLGQTIIMLKDNWYAQPSEQLNPRITIATDHAPSTEAALREKGVTIADPVQAYDDGFYVGSFLDSEGNKFWFCSPVTK